MSDTDWEAAERREFEAWFDTTFDGVDNCDFNFIDGTNIYAETYVQHRWEGWLARTEKAHADKHRQSSREEQLEQCVKRFLDAIDEYFTPDDAKNPAFKEIFVSVCNQANELLR